MIAARASSAFVCFRCELHIARPQLDVLSRHSRHSRAAFSTSVHRRNGDETGPTQPPNLIRYTHEQPNSPKRIRKARVRATTARLGAGVTTLGDDAKILVIKDVENATPEDVPKPDVIPLPSQETIDLLASLQDEAKPLTLEEIAKQLDSLRPQGDVDGNIDEAQYVDQKTFRRLYGMLVKGFTNTQLSHYYSTAKGVEHKEVAGQVLERLKQLQDDAKRAVDRSAWHPGTTAISERLPSLHSIQQKRAKRNAITKKTLVDQILRDIWKLVLIEEIEAPGDIELVLKPWQLTLLQSGPSPTPLDRVGKSRRAKIQIDTNVIRITADKTTAEYAADDIEKLLHDIETKRFDLNEWIPYLSGYKESEGINPYFPETALKTISELTQASVQVVAGNALSIVGLGKSAIVEAEQCILKLLPWNESASQSLDASRRDAAGVESYLAPAHFETHALKFHWRDQNLGRWTVPQTKPAEHNDSATNVDSTRGNGDVKAHLMELLDRTTPHSVDPFDEPSTGWASVPKQYLNASYGHVLFPEGSSQLETEPEYRPFLRTTPGLTQVLADRDMHPRARLRPPTLNYYFVAAPSQPGFEKGQRFPELRLQFSYAETGEYVLRAFEINYNMHFHDVLIPDKAMDVRFMVGNTLRLRVSKLAQNKNAMACVETISSNIDNGRKLTAPNFDLEIPACTIAGYESHTQEMKTVQYIFAGVRSRQSVSVVHNGIDVGITTVQGGKLSNKGTKVSTFFNTAPQGDQSDRTLFDRARDDSLLTNYINGTFELVEKFTGAARENKSWTTKLNKRPPAEAAALANLSPRNLEKGRNPALFGEPSTTDVDADPTTQENEPTSSQLQNDDIENPTLKDALSSEESVQNDAEVQGPNDHNLSPNGTDDAAADRKDDDASIKSPA